MIHYLDMDIKGTGIVQFMTPDTPNPYPEEPEWVDETIKSLELTIDQHYGLRLHTRPDGIVFIQIRQAGGWTRPIPFVEHVQNAWKHDEAAFKQNQSN